MPKALCKVPACNAFATLGEETCWWCRPKTKLLRHTPMPRVNSRRKRQRDAEAFGAQAQACREAPCCACGAPPPSDPHHVKSRGAGGKDDECVPLCRDDHNLLHNLENKYAIDLDEVKARMQEAVNGEV